MADSCANCAKLEARCRELEAALNKYAAEAQMLANRLANSTMTTEKLKALLAAPPAEGPKLPLGHEFRRYENDPYGFSIGLCSECGQPRAFHEPAEGEKRG